MLNLTEENNKSYHLRTWNNRIFWLINDNLINHQSFYPLISCQLIKWLIISALRRVEMKWLVWIWLFIGQCWNLSRWGWLYRKRKEQKLIKPTISPPSSLTPPTLHHHHNSPPPTYTVCPGGCTSGCCGAESLAVPPLASGRCPAGRTWRRPRRRR